MANPPGMNLLKYLEDVCGRAGFYVVIVLLLHLVTAPVWAQQPVMRNYSVEDGLPSSEVYNVVQDQRGYIWFATDHGVARFDGYDFDTYTSADGLTGNTCFHLYEDYRGWMWTWDADGKLSYFRNDSIFQYEYNHLLPRSGVGVSEISIDNDNSLHVFYAAHTDYALIHISAAGEVIDKVPLEFRQAAPDRYNIVKAVALPHTRDIGVYLHQRLTYRHLENSTPIQIGKSKLLRNGKDIGCPEARVTRPFEFGGHRGSSGVEYYRNQRLVYRVVNGECAGSFEAETEVLDLWEDGKGDLWVGTSRGGYWFKNGEFTNPLKFLQRESISGLTEDHEGGMWLTTLEHGVYYCNDRSILNYDMETGLQDNEVRGLALGPTGALWAGLKNGSVMRVRGDTVEKVEIPPLGIRSYYSGFGYDREGRLLLPLRVGRIMRFDGVHTDTVTYGHAFYRHAHYSANGPLYLAGSYEVIIYDGESIAWASRWTAESVSYQFRVNAILDGPDNRVYLAGLRGLFVSTPDQLAPQQVPELTNRINDMVLFHDSILVCATSGHGLQFWDGHNLITINRESHRLTSDIINTLAIDNDTIYAGTSAGLSRIVVRDFEAGDFEVVHFTRRDGLSSNEIHDIVVSPSHIYLATNAGITFFPKGFITLPPTAPPVYIEGIELSSGDTSIEPKYTLDYKGNFITIRFTGLTYHNPGNLKYRYRLAGIDDRWRETRDRSVNFTTLPKGTYRFEVAAAMENSDEWSETTAPIAFEITPPYYDSWWFRSLMVLGLVALSYLVFVIRLRQIKRQEQEQTALNKRIAELELKALRSQMNPHFTFNTMNAIQNFISNNSGEEAQAYLGKFARLMRMILENSHQKTIAIEGEIELLRIYLDLEALRFQRPFTYQISLEEDIEADFDMIPPMLLQPYLENAIWHGFSSREGQGHIDIHFARQSNQMVCTIQDNGIGRKASAAGKSPNRSGHKSMGMSITHERLEAIQSDTGKPASAIIEDLQDEAGNALGTRVILRLPLL